MRDYETIIKALDLTGHFKKHPAFIAKHGKAISNRLLMLIENAVSCAELGTLHNQIHLGNFGGIAFADETERDALLTTVDLIWRDLGQLENRTLDEGRMKPEKLYALQDDDTKTVFQVRKVLEDREQGARNMQSGLTKANRQLKADNERLKADIDRLKAALKAAQIALADARQKP